MTRVVKGKQCRGRPQTRWKDIIKVDVHEIHMKVEAAENREQWRKMIQATDPD